MRILSAIVEPLVLEVFDTGYHFSFRRALALELVCNEHTRDVPQSC
jgi:hypothetical protein